MKNKLWEMERMFGERIKCLKRECDLKEMRLRGMQELVSRREKELRSFDMPVSSFENTTMVANAQNLSPNVQSYEDTLHEQHLHAGSSDEESDVIETSRFHVADNKILVQQEVAPTDDETSLSRSHYYTFNNDHQNVSFSQENSKC